MNWPYPAATGALNSVQNLHWLIRVAAITVQVGDWAFDFLTQLWSAARARAAGQLDASGNVNSKASQDHDPGVDATMASVFAELRWNTSCDVYNAVWREWRLADFATLKLSNSGAETWPLVHAVQLLMAAVASEVCPSQLSAEPHRYCRPHDCVKEAVLAAIFHAHIHVKGAVSDSLKLLTSITCMHACMSTLTKV